MESYRIELLKPEDFNHLIPLMKDSFGLDVSVDYFKWKFLENPAGTFIGFVAISSDNQYAAYYGVIPEVYNFGETLRVIYQSCDTMTHSRHRRKGLFQRLAIACYDHLRMENKLFVVGFGGGQSTPGFIKFGWKKVFDMHYLFRPSLRSRISTLFKVSSKKFVVTDGVGVNSISSMVNLRKKTNITQRLTDVFLNWRLSNPARAYKIKIINTPKSQSVGYFIYYVEKDKIILFDFFTPEKEVIAEMILALDLLSKEMSAKGIVTFSQPGSEFYKQLRSNGFWTNPTNKGPLHEKIPFIFYATETELAMYDQARSWNIIPICHDSF